MRSKNLKHLKSFFTFDLPVNYTNIYGRFCKIHNEQRNIYAQWPTTATRGQMINIFWQSTLKHYLLIAAVALVIVTLRYAETFYRPFLCSVFVCIITYIPIYYLTYRTIFNIDFLPKLETAIAAYESRERTWREKCKQDQLSNRALVFLFYVFDKTSKVNYLAPSDKCADLLHKLYGVSPKGMKNELDLVYKKDKRVKLEHRHLVEVGKSFEEAYAILEAMQFDEGIQRLKQLEQRFQRP